MTKFIILDIETTGLDPKLSATIEIGAVKLCEGTVIDHYEALIKPRVAVDAGAFATHGLSDEFLLANGRPPLEVFREFFQWIDGGTLVAHHGIGFDFPFLAEECERYQIERPPLRLLDSLILARRLLSVSDGGFSLKALCHKYCIVNEKAHRALSDARALEKVFQHILQSCPNPDLLWEASFQREFHRLLEAPQGFEWLKESIDSGGPVLITYQTQGKPPARERWVRPLNFSISWNGLVGLRAQCLETHREKLFRLDRIGQPHHSNDNTPK